MLILLLVCIQKWYLELGRLNEPSILRVDKHVDGVRLQWVRWAWVEACAILGLVSLGQISDHSACLISNLAIFKFERWQLSEWSTELFLVCHELWELNCNVLDFIFA